MQTLADERVWVPRTEEEKEQVRRQMDRLLETSHFRNSKRYPALFRFIVEETLEGRGEFLKERLLGIRVFDRPADYDTASDPIVRVTIAEIRKRIAQYYHEEAHDAEMRIELLPGHYEPEFRPRRAADSDRKRLQPTRFQAQRISVPTTQLTAAVEPTAADHREKRRGRSRRAYLWAAAGLVLLAVAGVTLWAWMRPTALDMFWRPVLAAKQPVIFCIPVPGWKKGIVEPEAAERSPSHPTGSGASPTADFDPTFLEHENSGENVVFSDARAALKIAAFLGKHDRESKLKLSPSTTLDDLRQTPAVLIGGLDNPWSSRALNPLRYRFMGSDQEQYWIGDARDPSNRQWGFDLKQPYTAVARDFAIIARIHDQSTGQVEVIVAGIGMSGTAAAGEFLVDPQQMMELRNRVGREFADRDFEAVLSTNVVNGIAGPAKILAVTTW